MDMDTMPERCGTVSRILSFGASKHNGVEDHFLSSHFLIIRSIISLEMQRLSIHYSTNIMSPITCQKSNSVATTAHVSCLSTQPELANVYISFQFSIIKSQNFVFCFPRILYPKQRLQNPSDVIGIQLLHVITFNMHLETVKYSRHGHKTQPGIR